MMFRSPHGILLVALLAALAAAPGPSPESTAERIRHMTPAEKEQLERRQRQFAALPLQEQERLRALHREISSAPDSEQLLQVMMRYHNWLKSLSSAERADLQGMSHDARIAQIKKMLREQEVERFQQYAESRLDASDMDVIEKWLGDVVARHPEAFAKLLLPRERERFLRADRRYQLFAVHGAIFQGQRLQAVDLPAEDFDDLTVKLSPTAQEALAALTEPERKSEMIRTWVRAAVLANMRELWKKRFEVDAEVLLKFRREQLKPEDQEWLDNLEPTLMRRELTRLYYEWRDGAERRRGARRRLD